MCPTVCEAACSVHITVTAKPRKAELEHGTRHVFLLVTRLPNVFLTYYALSCFAYRTHTIQRDKSPSVPSALCMPKVQSLRHVGKWVGSGLMHETAATAESGEAGASARASRAHQEIL